MVREEPLTAEAIRRCYVAKAEAELADATAGTAGSADAATGGSGEAAAGRPGQETGSGPTPRGAPDGRVLLVKGEPSERDLAAGEAMAGRDGEALDSAFEALGWGADALLRVCAGPLGAERLRAVVEAADPDVVVALDPQAAGHVASSLGLEALEAGRLVTASGRRVLAVEPFERALADEAVKRRVWAQLKSLAREG